MSRYLDAIGWSHAAIGGLGVLAGLLLVLAPVAMFLYSVYDFVYGALYLMADPIWFQYAIPELVWMTVLSLAFLVPAVVVLVAYGVELFAGVSILRRSPRARLAGFAACVPAAFAFGVLGIALGVGTVMVLNDDEVRAQLA